MESNEKFHSPKTCPGCGKVSSGDFCTFCGETLDPKRTTFLHFIKGFPELFLGWKFNIFRTIAHLFLHPGQMLRSYLSGNHKIYYKPVQFFIAIAGIVLLLFLGYHISAPDSSIYEQFLDNKELGRKLDKVNTDSLTSMLMLQFPIVAFLSWLFYRKKGYYFGEHLTANAFFIGEVSLYKIVLFPVYYFNNKTEVIDTLDIFYAVFVIGYYTYAFYDWLYHKKSGIGFIKSFLFVLTVYFILTIISFLILIPLIYLYQTGVSALFR